MRLISKIDYQKGGIRNINEIYQEAAGTLAQKEHFVKRCAIIATSWEAAKVVREGLVKGWRFFILEDFVVSLWAPATWKPITYKMRNDILWKILKEMKGRGEL